MFQLDKSNYYHWETKLDQEESVCRFLPVKNQTQCIFSKNSFLCGHKMIDDDENYSNELQFIRVIPYFVHFCLTLSISHETPESPIDGIVFCFPSHCGDTFKKISCFLDSFLEFLSVYNPHRRTLYEASQVDRFWIFQFLSEEMFAIVFGECYNEFSSRYMFGVSQTFLLFQSNRTFERHEMPSLPEYTPKNKFNVRNAIRSSYKSKGRDYHKLEKDQGVSAVAEQFVQPTSFLQDYKPWHVIAQENKNKM